MTTNAQDAWGRFSGVPRNELEKMVLELEAKLERVERDRDTYCENLTSVQRRCSELLLEARDARQRHVPAQVAETPSAKVITQRFRAPPGQLNVLADILRERLRQDEKWGPLASRVDVPDGTGGALFEHRLELRRPEAEVHCAQTRRQTCCWAHVLDEECAEALAESDPEKLRGELVQVAATSVVWIEVIDRRAAP
jgi:hypothetical protein